MDIRHLEVQKNNEWEWKSDAVGVVTCADEIIHGHLAVGNDLKWTIDPALLEGMLHHEDVILIVLDQQDRFACHFMSSALRSSIQKRLPLSPSDSTPAVPSMRCMAFRTMARPTPVPS